MINRYAIAGLLAVLAVVGVVAHAAVVVSGGGGSDARPSDRAADTGAPAPADPTASATPSATAKDAQLTTLPKQKTKSLAQAAKLAGCTVAAEANEGAEHVTRELTAADYGTNPPTSGMHNPEWASDEI
jgi:hypothetical protein